MYMICVNGSPGSGKTTLSNELLKTEKTEVLHLDHLLNRLKNALPETSVDKIYRDGGEVYPHLNRDGFVYKFIHTKYINDVYNYVRKLYVKRELKRLKEEAIENGVEYFIVEGVNSSDYWDVVLYDYKIFVCADMSERMSRLKYRDRNTTAPLCYDIYMINPNNTDFSYYDVVITNNGTLEEYLMVIEALGEAIKDNRGTTRKLEN